MMLKAARVKLSSIMKYSGLRNACIMRVFIVARSLLSVYLVGEVGILVM